MRPSGQNEQPNELLRTRLKPTQLLGSNASDDSTAPLSRLHRRVRLAQMRQLAADSATFASLHSDPRWQQVIGLGAPALQMTFRNTGAGLAPAARIPD
jgi:hypothetical protein